MKRLNSALKWSLRFLAGSVGLWFVIGIIVVSVVIPDTKIETIIHEELNKVIKVKNVYSDAKLTFASTFPNFSLVLKDFYLIDTLKNPCDTIFSLKKMKVDLDIPALLEGKIGLKKIELLKPYVHINIDSSGINLMQLLSQKSDTTEIHPIISLDNLSIRNLSVKYDNYLYSKFLTINDANLDFKGQINTQDSTLDITYGKLYVEKNASNFKGRIDNDGIDITLTYEFDNLPKICNTLANLTGEDAFEKIKINGAFSGEFHVYGQSKDTTSNGIVIRGNSKGRDINILSSNKQKVVNSGEFDIDIFHNIIHKDSLKININSLKLIGDNIYLDTKGIVTHYNNDFHFNSIVNSNGDLTKLSKQTSFLKKGAKLKGKYDLYVNISTSLDSLLHNYKYPKKIDKLTSGIKIPNIHGQLEVHNFCYEDTKISLITNNLKSYFDGSKGAIFKINYDNLKINTKGHYFTSNKTDILINGETRQSHFDISQIGYINSEGKDTTSVRLEKINLTLKPKAKNKNMLSGTLEEINLTKDRNTLFAAKMFLTLQNNIQKNGQNSWEVLDSRIFIANFKNKDLTSYGKIIKGKCIYTDKLSNVAVTCDSIDIQIPKNELIVYKLNLNGNNDSYHITAGNIQSKQLDYGIPLNVKGITADYIGKNINFSTGSVSFGESQIMVNGSASLQDKNKTKIIADISGQHLNINQILIAENLHALEKGDPNAIPLNEIKKGTIPRGIGNEKSDVRLNLNLKLLTISSLTLDNAKGSINIKGNEILLDNITSIKGNDIFRFSSLYKYIDTNLSTITVSLDGQKMNMERLGEILPEISNISPMLSALEGTADFKIDMSMPVHRVIKMDIAKTTISASLQTHHLSITDNETLANIAKLLMFKNKTKTEIDSLAVAAKIDNGNVEILPFMMKVDRYKVAIAGTSNLNTEEIDYHISVLKSPIPFKFGINVTGNQSPYKIKLVKTQYKKLDPDIMPWTDPKFVNFKESINAPISNFRKRFTSILKSADKL